MALATLLLALTHAEPEAGADCPAAVPGEASEAAEARFREGQQLMAAARLEEAEAPLLRAVALDSRHALAHYALGETYMGLRRYPQAVAAFERSRGAFRCLGGLSAEDRKRAQRRLRDEIRDVRAGIRTAEEQRARENLILWKEVNGDTRTPGDKLRALESLRERLETLERTLRGHDTEPAGVTLALGTARFQAGDLEGAEREFRALLAAEPGSGDAHNNLAVLCLATGRLGEAERELAAAEKAGVQINPRLKQEIEKRRRAEPPKP